MQVRMQLLHISRAQHQAVMVHVGSHPLPGGDRPDVDDRLGGDPRRDEAHSTSPEGFQSQELQAEHVRIKVDGSLTVLGIHYNMVQTHYVHDSLPTGCALCAWIDQVRSSRGCCGGVHAALRAPAASYAVWPGVSTVGIVARKQDPCRPTNNANI